MGRPPAPRDHRVLDLALGALALGVSASLAGLAAILYVWRKGVRTFPVLPAGGIVISGASSGIGRHAAETLAGLHQASSSAGSSGYLVFAGVRSDHDYAEIEGLGLPNLLPLRLDVTDQASIAAAAATVRSTLQQRSLPLVAVVNNAGITMAMPMELTELDQLRGVLEVNLIGAVAMTKAFAPQLRESPGSRLINVGSFLGLTVAPLYGAYSASKFALEAVTDATRMELGGQWGISVSLLEPGSIRTRIQAKTVSDQAPYRHLRPEQYALYRRSFEAWDEAIRRHEDEAASGHVSLTSQALVHAITSPQPRTRYVLGVHQGVPLAWSALLLPLLPDRLQDQLKLHNTKV